MVALHSLSVFIHISDLALVPVRFHMLSMGHRDWINKLNGVVDHENGLPCLAKGLTRYSVDAASIFIAIK